MGQHKHNPTAKLAKAGKLPPKAPKRRITKRESEDLVIGAIGHLLYPDFLGLLGRRRSANRPGQ